MKSYVNRKSPVAIQDFFVGYDNVSFPFFPGASGASGAAGGGGGGGAAGSSPYFSVAAFLLLSSSRL